MRTADVSSEEDDAYIAELEEDLRCAAIAGQLALGREATARVALRHANARCEDVEAERTRMEDALRRANERGADLAAALAAAEAEVREMSERLGERRQRANRDDVALRAAESNIEVLRRRIASLEELRQEPLRDTLGTSDVAAGRAVARPPPSHEPLKVRAPPVAAETATESAEMVAQRANIAKLTSALAASAAALREARAEAAAERRSGVARLAREQRALVEVREDLARAAAAERTSSALASAPAPAAPLATAPGGRGALLLRKLRAGTISQEEYDHLAPLVRYDAWHEAQQQRAPAVPRTLLLHCLASVSVARAVVVGTPPFAQYEVRVRVAPRGGSGRGGGGAGESASASAAASPCVFEWTVRRRFSEFRMLHVQLRSRCAAALDLVPQFPRRRLDRSVAAPIVEQRRAALDAYAGALLARLRVAGALIERGVAARAAERDAIDAAVRELTRQVAAGDVSASELAAVEGASARWAGGRDARAKGGDAAAAGGTGGDGADRASGARDIVRDAVIDLFVPFLELWRMSVATDN